MRNIIIDSIKRGSVYAIIPARSGSKGIPDKNIRLLGGYPMIAFSIVAAKLSNCIDRIIVSTDSKQYANIAIQYGANDPILRPAEISQDKSTDFEFMEHAINWLFDNEGIVPEYFIHLRPTNPLREIDIIENAMKKFKTDNNATSLRSAHKVNYMPYKWFYKDEKEYFNPIVSGITLDDANDPRQSFPQVYVPDGYIDILRTEYIVKNNKIHGNLMIGFESPESVDVDYKEDFEKLEYLINKKNSDVYQYLKNHFDEVLHI